MIRFAENLNKMIAAGLGGALEAPRTEAAVGHRIIHKDASGAVATFNTNIAALIRSLRVDMQPIQDLHGQDAPYPAGGGKNKFQITATTSIKNGLTCTINADGTAMVSGTATATTDFTLGKFNFDGSAYMLSGCPVNGSSSTYMLWVIGYIGLADTGAGKEQSSVSGTGKNVAIRVMEGTTVNNLLFKPMLCLSTESNPTVWSPYENICPISGRNSVTVWRGAVYDPSADPALTIQLGQTVYGGSAEIISGQGRITKALRTFSELSTYNSWHRLASNGAFYLSREIALPGIFYPITFPYEDKIPISSVYKYSASGTQPDFSMRVSDALYIIDSRFQTVGEFQAALAQMEGGIVYKLAEPQAFTLTPASLSTLKGQNNVWSNVGDVTLEYPYYEETEGY